MRFLLLVTLAALAGCATSQTSQADLAPDASRGTIVLSLAGSRSFLDALMLAPYNPATGTIAGGTYVSLDMYRVSNLGYVWKSVRPGTYVVHSLLHQGAWDLCFNADTQAFTVAAGQTVYLGTFNPQPYVAALTQDALAAGDTKLSSKTIRSYFDAPPARVDADARFPESGGPLQIASGQAVQATKAMFIPATFQPGTDYFGTGGLFHVGGRTCFGGTPGIDVMRAQ